MLGPTTKEKEGKKEKERERKMDEKWWDFYESEHNKFCQQVAALNTGGHKTSGQTSFNSKHGGENTPIS